MVSRRFLLLGLFSTAATGCARLAGRSHDAPQDSDLNLMCADYDIDQYFSFTISDDLKLDYFGSDYDPGNQWNVDIETVNLIRNALVEILNTPEGYDVINLSVERFNGNKIHFDIDDFNFVGEADMSSGIPFIRVSNSWAAQRQTFESDGRVNQLTMQRLLVHELYHIYAGHVSEAMFDTEYEREQHEEEAVRFADRYMQKYYGDEPRVRYSNVGLQDGTEGWDFGQRLFTCRPSV